MAIGDDGTSNFTLIPFDTSILSLNYQAKLALQAAQVQTKNPAAASASRGPAVTAPWELLTEEDSLAKRMNEVRNIDSFIDLRSDEVDLAGNDRDSKALFALYTALDKLKTIAEYSANEKTPSGILGALDKMFQQGMSEIQDYLQEVDLDKLALLFGQKTSKFETVASVGKNVYETVGTTVQKGAIDEAIPGVAGTEVFTVSLSTSSRSDDFEIDLAQLGKPPTIGNIAAFINEKIAAVQALDSGGNPVVDSDGEPVGAYTTRFRTEKVGKEGYALKIEGTSVEQVSFAAATTEPALYVTGTHKGVASDAITTGTLTQFTSLNSGDPVRIYRNTVAGIGEAPLVLPDDDSKETDAEEVKATLAQTTTSATTADSQGNVYVVGSTQGDFGNQINKADTSDVYLTKYDANGTAVWSRLVGASDKASGYSVTVDGEDNVIIAGQVNNDIGSSKLFSGEDSFVTKYASDGEEVWTHQFDTIASDAAFAITVDASNNVVIAGQISGNLNASTNYGGGRDAYVAILGGADGQVTATTQFGGAGDEFVNAIGVAADGNIVVGGIENGEAIVRKLDATNLANQLYSVNLGPLSGGSIQALKVDGNSIYVAGYSGNPSLGGSVVAAHQGSTDGYVIKLNDNGGSANVDWTSYVGTAEADIIDDLVVADGSVYVAGKTSGTLAGNVKSGSSDAFAAKLDANTGTQAWVEQIGGLSGTNGATGVAFSTGGYSVLNKLGFSSGTVETKQTRDIETQTTARAGDHFYISINDGRQQKITIEEGDDFRDLAVKINRLSFRYIKAEQTFGTDGGTLSIKPLNGATIEIFAGKGDQDALKAFGVLPTRVLPASELYDITDDKAGTNPEKLGGVFGLNLLSSFNVRDKSAAAYVSKQLEAAIGTVQRAFRSLTYDPVKAALLEQSKLQTGTVSPYQQSQLSRYQDALNRVSAITGSGFTT